MLSADYETGNVGNVGDKIRPDFVRDFGERFENAMARGMAVAPHQMSFGLCSRAKRPTSSMSINPRAIRF